MRWCLVLLLLLSSCDSVRRLGPDGGLDGPAVRDRADRSSTATGGSFCTAANGCWEAPLPQGNSLGGVWGSGEADVYAVGSAGTIMHFDGKTWEKVALSTTAPLMAVWGSGPDNVYVVSNSQTLLHFDGTSWQAQSQPVFGEATIRDIWGSGPKDVYVVGSGGLLAHYDGSSWKAQRLQNEAGGHVNVDRVWGSSPSDVWAVSYEGIWHFDGTSWRLLDTSPTQPINVSGIWGSGPKNVFFNGNTVVRFDGTHFTETELPDKDKTNPGRMWGRSASEIYAIRSPIDEATKDPRPQLWRYDGSSWSPLPEPPTAHRISGVWGAPSGRVFVVGDGGALLAHTAAGGWVSSNKLAGGDTLCLWGTASSNVFAGRRGGEVLHRDATGWTSSSIPGGGDVQALWGTDPSSVYASCGGGMWRFDGTSWTKMSAPDVAFTSGLWGRSGGEIYATVERTEKGTIGPAVMRFDGTSWTVMKELNTPAFALWGTGAKDLFVGGAGILHHDGQTWRESPLGTVPATATIRGLWGDGPRNVYAVGFREPQADGLILHYDGAWARLEIPTVSRLYAVFGQNAGEIYAAGTAGSRGEVLFSDGNTWVRMETAVDPVLHALWGDGAQSLFAGGMNGAILHRRAQ